MLVSMEQLLDWLSAFGRWLLDGLIWLIDGIAMVSRHVTQDHIEGGLVIATAILGPSLLLALLRGLWEGLRIEWQEFRELPRVIDGDTIEVRGESIRLFAVDTPEMGQPWWDKDGTQQDAGVIAKEALEKLVDGKRLDIRVLREDKYRRSLAIVKIDGRDVGRKLVSQGYGFASPGSGRYSRTQASAKRRKRGFWKGEFQMPWDYRAVA